MIRKIFQKIAGKIFQRSSKEELCVLRVLDREFRDNSLASRIENISYPFLQTLNKRRTTLWKHEIEQINCLAHHAFASGESLGTPSELIRWQQASPDSWLVCKVNNEIYGYVHIEPLAGAKGDAIQNGISHEGEIDVEDILKASNLTENDYIHIGSIVSRPGLDYNLRQEVAIRLLAGMMDRVLELSFREEDGAHRVIAVDYSDAEGRHHAKRLFQRYGFKHHCSWKTSENPPNDVYILDLSQSYSPDLYRLAKAVLARKAKYRVERRNQHRKIIRISSLGLVLASIIFSIVFTSTTGWLPAIFVASSVGMLDSTCSLVQNANEEIKKLEKIERNS